MVYSLPDRFLITVFNQPDSVNVCVFAIHAIIYLLYLRIKYTSVVLRCPEHGGSVSLQLFISTADTFHRTDLHFHDQFQCAWMDLLWIGAKAPPSGRRRRLAD